MSEWAPRDRWEVAAPGRLASAPIRSRRSAGCGIAHGAGFLSRPSCAARLACSWTGAATASTAPSCSRCCCGWGEPARWFRLAHDTGVSRNPVSKVIFRVLVAGGCLEPTGAPAGSGRGCVGTDFGRGITSMRTSLPSLRFSSPRPPAQVAASPMNLAKSEHQPTARRLAGVLGPERPRPAGRARSAKAFFTALQDHWWVQFQDDQTRGAIWISLAIRKGMRPRGGRPHREIRRTSPPAIASSLFQVRVIAEQWTGGIGSGTSGTRTDSQAVQT